MSLYKQFDNFFLKKNTHFNLFNFFFIEYLDLYKNRLYKKVTKNNLIRLQKQKKIKYSKQKKLWYNYTSRKYFRRLKYYYLDYHYKLLFYLLDSTVKNIDFLKQLQKQYLLFFIKNIALKCKKLTSFLPSTFLKVTGLYLVKDKIKKSLPLDSKHIFFIKKKLGYKYHPIFDRILKYLVQNLYRKSTLKTTKYKETKIENKKHR